MIFNNFSGIFLLFLSLSCIKPQKTHYSFWKDYYNLQVEIRKLDSNLSYSKVLSGNYAKDDFAKLQKNETAVSFLSLAGDRKLGQWNLEWYPDTSKQHDYLFLQTFEQKEWKGNQILLVDRNIKSNWNGFYPKDFFLWLDSFISLVQKEEKIENIYTLSPSIEFLCQTFECYFATNEGYSELEFQFTEKTKSRFPDFYQRFANRLEKSKFKLKITIDKHQNDTLEIFNSPKSIIFHFPKNTDANFKQPKHIHFEFDIKINAYGVQYDIKGLQYELSVKLDKNIDQLYGKFTKYKERKLQGNFLYFIPTGIIDFFIPGNLDEYLGQSLHLLVYGSSGKGGSHLSAVYEKKGNLQVNQISSHTEIMFSKFSLFGADTNKVVRPENDFFLQWENTLLLDLNRH